MEGKENKQLKIVYAITERGEKSYWTRIGIATVNRDGSLNVRLDAVPVNGAMQVRDYNPREEGATGSRRNGGNAHKADDLPEAFA